jgi:ABC-2 type transport system permease protein
MTALRVAMLVVRGFVRDRAAALAVVLGPPVMVLLLASALAEAPTPRVALVIEDDSMAARQMAEALETTFQHAWVFRSPRLPDVRDAIAQGRMELAIVVPEGHGRDLGSGGTARIEVLERGDSLGTLLAEGAAAAVMERSVAIRAARFAQERTGLPQGDASALAEGLLAEVEAIDVVVETAGRPDLPAGGAPFAVPAQGALVLFVVLAPLLAVGQRRDDRRPGAAQGTGTAPMRPATLLGGEVLGRLWLALLPAVLVIVGAAIVLEVPWGDPLALGLIVGLLALVASGAALAAGSPGTGGGRASLRPAALSVGLAVLGGAVVPLELFGEPLATLARLTPHAWALEALRASVFGGADAWAVSPALGPLAVLAVVLLALGAWRLRRTPTRGSPDRREPAVPFPHAGDP